MIRRRVFLAVPFLLLGYLTGCGGGDSSVYAVKGKITINGQPAKDVQVSFIPVDPRGTTGSANVAPDGSYQVTSGSEGKLGLMPGKYKVVLAQMASADSAKYSGGGGGGNSSSAPTAPEASFPKEYLAVETSPKEVEVKPQANIIDISI